MHENIVQDASAKRPRRHVDDRKMADNAEPYHEMAGKSKILSKTGWRDPPPFVA
jgi:hypothetical protein